MKRPKAKPRQRQIKHASKQEAPPIAPLAPLDPEADTSDPGGLSPGRAEYIFADIWDELPGRSHCPMGFRGWLVLTIGDKWVRLFSPVSLDTYRLKVDEFDGLKRLEGKTYNPAAMLSRIQERRELCRHHGMFDGGRAADEAEALFMSEG
jgi:hypothetical protein